MTESQLQALEKPKAEKQAAGEIETEDPGCLIAQDAFYVGDMKGVGRIYQQTVIDTNSQVAFAKLYDRKNALVAADMLHDRVIPFFESKEIPVLHVLSDDVVTSTDSAAKFEAALKQWRKAYNEELPHSSPGHVTPYEYERRFHTSAVQERFGRRKGLSKKMKSSLFDCFYVMPPLKNGGRYSPLHPIKVSKAKARFWGSVFFLFFYKIGFDFLKV